MESKLTTLRDILVAKIAHVLKGKERSESVPKFMIHRNSIKPNHPLSMEILRRGKRHKIGCLV
jgi:hypothetical protein